MPKARRASKDGPRIPKANISAILRRHVGQRTVLGVAIPILSAHIEAAKSGRRSVGLTEKQIERAFRELNSEFVKSDYHSTYLHRGLARFLEARENRYKIREDLLADISVKELEQLRSDLTESLRTAYEKRQSVIKNLMAACSLPAARIKERHALVDPLECLSGYRALGFRLLAVAGGVGGSANQSFGDQSFAINRRSRCGSVRG